jgi:hypothetical protein
VKLRSRYLMVFRPHQRSGRSILGAAESDDGLRFNVRPEPFMAPATSGLFAEADASAVLDRRRAADGERRSCAMRIFRRTWPNS